ncbi:MAG: hypothetical protein FWD61_09070 [Phycisphaerales bacterium]|nr:hypothetical protein [Phycisphaerales bacterium]
MVTIGQPNETYDEWRTRMLAETTRFIEWGLKHPEKVTWIPMHPVGKGNFPERLKQVFWSIVTEDKRWPES